MKKENKRNDLKQNEENITLTIEMPDKNQPVKSFESIRNLFQKVIKENPFPQRHTNGDFLKYIKYEAQKLKFYTPSQKSLMDIEKIDSCLNLESAEEYVESYVKNASRLNDAYVVIDERRELTDFGKSFLSSAPIIKLSYFFPETDNQKWIATAMRADGSREQAILLQMCEESYFGNSNNPKEVIGKIDQMLQDGGWLPLNESNPIDKVVISCIKNDAESAKKLKLDNPIGGIYTLSALIN